MSEYLGVITGETERWMQDRCARALDELIGDEPSPEYALWLLGYLAGEASRRRRKYRRLLKLARTP